MINTEIIPDANVQGTTIDVIHKIGMDILRGVAIPILCDAIFNRDSTTDGITMDSVQVRKMYLSDHPELVRDPPVEAVYVQEVKVKAKMFLRVVNNRIADQVTARVCKVRENIKDVHHSLEFDGEHITIRGEMPIGTTMLSMTYIDKLHAFTMIQPADVEWETVEE